MNKLKKTLFTLLVASIGTPIFAATTDLTEISGSLVGHQLPPKILTIDGNNTGNSFTQNGSPAIFNFKGQDQKWCGVATTCYLRDTYLGVSGSQVGGTLEFCWQGPSGGSCSAPLPLVGTYQNGVYNIQLKDQANWNLQLQ